MSTLDREVFRGLAHIVDVYRGLTPQERASLAQVQGGLPEILDRADRYITEIDGIPTVNAEAPPVQPVDRTVSRDGTPECPAYYRHREQGATHLWTIVCNEGWRSSIVCTGMYKWAADWLLDLIDGRPFAPETRP